MYFGPPFYDYDLNGQFVYLTIPGKRSLSMMKQNVLVLFICNHKKGNSHITTFTGQRPTHDDVR